MSNLSYVRTEMLGELDPPSSEVGIIHWLRANMFSSVGNSILTIVAGYFIFSVLASIMPWLWQSSWTSNSLGQCRETIAHLYGEGAEGACFSVITERYNQLLFGFYPSDLYWRPILAFVLLIVAIAPVLFASLPRKMLIFSTLYPLVGFWLIWGGAVWVPLFVLVGFVIGYLVARFVAPMVGSAIGMILTILLPLVWWFSLMGMASDGLYKTFSDMRMPAAIEALEESLSLGDLTDAEATTANRKLKRLQSLPDFLASKVTLDAEGAVLRGELPDELAGLNIVGSAPAGTSSEDLDKLEEVLKVEISAINANNAIQAIYKDVGSIGLQPIPSDKLGGFTLSIIIGITGIVFSLPLGILLALGRQSNLFVVKAICVGFIEFIRGVPLITLLFVASTLLNYFMPPGTSFDLVLRVMIMVTLFASAYMAEVIRGGLAALPTGQYEAADALGLDYWKATRLIIMPQALKISIPNIVSNFIGLFKDTTLVSIIGLMDPIGLSTAIRANQAWNGIVWELYVFIALLFFIVCFSMSRYSMYLERKLKTGH